MHDMLAALQEYASWKMSEVDAGKPRRAAIQAALVAAGHSISYQ